MSNDRLHQTNTERQMASLIGMGKVAEVNLGKLTARVRDGDILTGWLRMGMMRALGDAMTWPYEVGEEVAYATLSGEGRTGFIICALPNGASDAQAAQGVLRAKAGGGFVLDGDVEITGGVNVGKGIQTVEDVVAGTKSLQGHNHPHGVGPGITGDPI